MNSTTQNNINFKLLTDFAHLTNSRDRKGFNLCINGEKIKAKTSSEASRIINEKASAQLDYESWWNDIKKDILADANAQNIPQKDWAKFFQDTLKKAIDQFAINKINERDGFTKVLLPDAFQAEFTPCSFKPSCTINEVDLDIVDGLCYCKENALFYFKSGNNYTLLGDRCDLISKGSKQLDLLYAQIVKRRILKTGRIEYDFWKELYDTTDKINDEYWKIAEELEAYLKVTDLSNCKFGDAEDVNVTIFGKDYPLHSVLQLKHFKQISEEGFDMKRLLHTFIIKIAINEKLPAMMLNQNLANIYYETTADGGFKRYSIKSPKGNKCSIIDYLSKIFEESTILKTKIPLLDVVPRIISDTGAPAKYYIDKKWMDGLGPQLSLEESKGFNAFIRPYTEEERIAIMGWAYTCFHPSTHDYINFLFKTGGGTFKTNYYEKQIENILKEMYKPESLIVHEITGDSWVSDSFRKEGVNSGISTSALVFNDECTAKSIEEFKNMSGGSTEGVNYQYRVMRENPISMKVFAKWLFCTNNNIVIQDDSGAYDRRLFIIDRMDVKKLNPPYRSDELENGRRMEMLAFYNEAKRCYEEACRISGTFSSFVQNTRNIHKNISQAYKSENKVSAYTELWNRMNERFQASVVIEGDPIKLKDGSIAVKSDWLQSEMSSILMDNEIQWKNFRSFITNDSDYFVSPNIARYSFRIGDRKFSPRYRLYPLKDEYKISYEEVESSSSIQHQCGSRQLDLTNFDVDFGITNPVDNPVDNPVEESDFFAQMDGDSHSQNY